MHFFSRRIIIQEIQLPSYKVVLLSFFLNNDLNAKMQQSKSFDNQFETTNFNYTIGDNYKKRKLNTYAYTFPQMEQHYFIQSTA